MAEQSDLSASPTSGDVDVSQSWFWSPQWQRMEREADADILGGDVVTSDSNRTFLDSLRGA
jgi:hypothetical protein